MSFPIGTDRITSRYIGKNAWNGFNDFMNMAFQPGRGYDERYGDMNNQLTNARNSLNNLNSIKSIDFDFTKTSNDPRVNNKFLSEIPALWNDILDNVDFNQNWMVFYNFDDRWRSRKLDEVNQDYLRDQISEDFRRPLIQGSINLGVQQADYDFFPVSIRQLKAVRFVNTSKFNAGTQLTSTGEPKEVRVATWEESDAYRRGKAANFDDATMNMLRQGWAAEMRKKGYQISKRPYKRKQGSFWRWTCTIPINLERYMIFNELNERTIRLMEEDNCLIYACKQFGVDQDIIDHMKDIIKTKSFTMSKLKEIAQDTGVGFYLEEVNGRHHKIGPQDNIVVPLLLMNEHYMLNEKVRISPYFIKHYYEIIADPVSKKKKPESLVNVTRKREINGKMYYVGENKEYPLKLILRTLFECECFAPIKMGDYLTYASTLYKYKLDPIDSLDYNPRFCCRLKAPRWKSSKSN